jgi:hypothetical protein
MKVPTPRYRSPLARLLPEPRPDPETIKRDGWREQHILVVNANDRRLDTFERELVRRIGNRLYGSQEHHHD